MRRIDTGGCPFDRLTANLVTGASRVTPELVEEWIVSLDRGEGCVRVVYDGHVRFQEGQLMVNGDCKDHVDRLFLERFFHMPREMARDL